MKKKAVQTAGILCIVAVSVMLVTSNNAHADIEDYCGPMPSGWYIVAAIFGIPYGTAPFGAPHDVYFRRCELRIHGRYVEPLP